MIGNSLTSTSMDLILRRARRVIDGTSQLTTCDIGIQGDRIVAVEPQLEVTAPQEIDTTGYLVSPPFVDAHFHLDSTLSLGQPRLNQSGTLLEGIGLWSELKPLLTPESVYERVLTYCDWAVAQGLLAIRAHVDICDPRFLAVDALIAVKQRVRSYLDLQLVAFPQEGYLRYPKSLQLMEQALDRGVDVVGGIPHFERTRQEGNESVKALCRLAADRGVPVDLHCDETDDPQSRFVEVLARETLRYGLQGRVTGSHLTSMHSLDNYYVSKLIPLMQEAQLQVVANPLINITLQGRHDTYPRRRGMTRVPELLAAGLTVAFGQDCVMDPWYSLGSGSLLEVAHMGLHVAQMTGIEAMMQCFAAVTIHPARIVGLEGYGLAPGCYADLIVLQASDPIEAIRLRALPLYVLRRGRVIAQTAPRITQLQLPGRPSAVDCRHQILSQNFI